MRLLFLHLWTRNWHTCAVLSGQLPQELLLPNLQTEQLFSLKGQELIISLHHNHHNHHNNLPSVLVTLYVLSILRPHHRDGGREGRQLIWTGCSTPAEQHCRTKRSTKHVFLLKGKPKCQQPTTVCIWTHTRPYWWMGNGNGYHKTILLRTIVEQLNMHRTK